MSKNTLLALAAFITSLANDSGAEPETPAAAAPEGGEAPPRRGRPPGKAASPTPAAEPEPEKPKGKTVEELREAIQPLVTEGRGAEVKALIKKHGGENLSGIPAANHAAFLKDVEGLAL